MSRNRPKYQKKPFESNGSNSDTSANIYMSMLMAPAWQDLSANQQRLYLYCKAQLYAEKRKPSCPELSNADNSLWFTMNQSKWAGLYHLYSRNNYAGFERDMQALIEHGFVACVIGGETTRTRNIYRYSSLWQKWGKPDFALPESDKTPAMRRQERK